jgi:hypothetical protein
VEIKFTEEEIQLLDEVSALPSEYPGWMIPFQGASRLGPIAPVANPVSGAAVPRVAVLGSLRSSVGVRQRHNLGSRNTSTSFSNWTARLKST